MTIQGSLSLSSIQAEITQTRISQQRSALAYQSQRQGQAPVSSVLNSQENQIADEVNISEAAIRQLEQTRELNNQLQRYLNYLKGKDNENQNIRIVTPDNRSEAIAARATSVEASVTAGVITETNIDIDFTIDDEGNLSQLTVSASQTTTEFVQTELALSDTQFYAYRNA